MKKSIKTWAVLSFTIALFALACQPENKLSNSVNPTETQTYKSIGVIKNIDTDAGKITIDHDEIPGYMAAMEMSEAVSDAKMLETLKIGDKVEFDLERTNSKLVITKLTKIGEVIIINGGEIYKMNCAECHNGVGEGTLRGISLLKGHALKHSEKEYIERVTNGKGKKMPSFKDKLSAEQITAIVKFIREELQKNVSKKAVTEHQH